MNPVKTAIMMFLAAGIVSGCGLDAREKQLDKFIKAHTAKLEPLMKESNLAAWRAANTGKAEDYEKAGELSFQVQKIYTNAQEFALLKEIKQSGQVKDARLARQLDELYNAYLASQIEPILLKKIVDLSTQIEKNFSTYRGTIEGKKVTDNEIREILKTEGNTTKRREAWRASKQVGPMVAADLIRLVKLRNEAARKVGFDNYHTLALTVGEQDVKELDEIFQQLYELTNAPYARLKEELDRTLAAKYGFEPGELMPWHYADPFFQEAPQVYGLNLDVYYENQDVRELAVKYYDGIGLAVESILERSDLYEREGKNPHAFCTDINRQGDIRILCNLKNNEQWMETILHELGHAVYDEYHEPQAPFLLREPAHIFTTEAIAMFFGRLSLDADWMQQMLGLTEEERDKIAAVSSKYAQLKQLIFARWAMVMYDFEKQLYADPDQDLNGLWWRLVEKYQFVHKPANREEPDWAAKIHFTIAPCYYHNYVLGELLASQLHYYIIRNVLQPGSEAKVSFVGQNNIGNYLREKIFAPANLYHWNVMIEKATGEPLTPKYFVSQFVK